MNVKLIWATPNGDDLIAYIARVSNPDNQDNKATAPKLLRYLLKHKHFSPFEMVNACVEINTERDITHQILRHRSFSFQEFSGRYADYEGLLDGREVRLQDTTNRQNALHCDDLELRLEWERLVRRVRSVCWGAYVIALRFGVAKEVARILLPEGLVPTRMYMNGTLRSWLHYWDVRCGPETQKEHREIAQATREAILAAYSGLAEILDVQEKSTT